MPASDPTGPDRPLPGASPALATARFWRRATGFSGRASRSEYWWPALLHAAALVLLTLLAGALTGAGGALRDSGSTLGAVPNALAGVVLLLLVVLLVALILPALAVSVRRLHDVDLSGLLVLLALIPSVGGLILLVLAVLPSNPAGRRFDRGAAAIAPPTPAAAPAPAAEDTARSDPVLPACHGQSTATAPMPLQRDVPTPNGIRAAWASVGVVRDVTDRLPGSGRRRVQTLLVARPDGIGLLATDGLAETEGAAALGAGAELFLPAGDLHDEAAAAQDWRSGVLAAVARRIQASGMHLPAELQQHAVLSMAVPVEAPPGWRADDGGVGVVIGLPLDGVPEAVPTPTGEVRLAGVLPLRPEELQRILDGGRAAREAIAGDLHALPASALADPDRPPL